MAVKTERDDDDGDDDRQNSAFYRPSTVLVNCALSVKQQRIF